MATVSRGGRWMRQQHNCTGWAGRQARWGLDLEGCDEGFVFHNAEKEKMGAAVKSENLLTYRYRAQKRGKEAIVTGFKPGKGLQAQITKLTLCLIELHWYNGEIISSAYIINRSFLKLSLCTPAVSILEITLVNMTESRCLGWHMFSCPGRKQKKKQNTKGLVLR